MATGRPVGKPAKPMERKRAVGSVAITAPAGPAPGEGIEGGYTPLPPSTLSQTGIDLWDHVWMAGRTWLAVESDRTIVSLLCHAHQEAEELRQGLESGDLQRVYIHANGSPVTTPWVTQLKELRAQMTSWLAAIGFSPSDRSRLGLAEVRVRDELDDLQRRRDARATGTK